MEVGHRVGAGVEVEAGVPGRTFKQDILNRGTDNIILVNMSCFYCLFSITCSKHNEYPVILVSKPANCRCDHS